MQRGSHNGFLSDTVSHKQSVGEKRVYLRSGLAGHKQLLALKEKFEGLAADFFR